jgi:hypothetical protein
MVPAGGEHEGGRVGVRIRRGTASVLILCAVALLWWTSRDRELRDERRGEPRLATSNGVPSEADAPSAPPIPPEREPKVAPDSAEESALEIRALEDGRVLPGFAVVTPGRTPAEPSVESTADALGVLRVPRDRIAAIRPRDGRWSFVPAFAAEAAVSGVVWVRESVRVRVVVDFPEADAVAAAVVPAVAVVVPLDLDGEGPGTLALWKRLGLHTDRVQARVADGDPAAFLADATRVRSLRVIASAAGHRPAEASVEVAPNAPEVVVHLSLQPGIVVSGRCVDENGDPVANAVVDAFVVRWLPWGVETPVTSDVAARFGPEGGVGLARLRDGTLRVRVRERAVTDEHGRFTVTTRSDGRLALFVNTPGRSAVRRDLGDVRLDLAGVDLLLPEAHGTYVTFEELGEPLSNAELSCTDISDPIQPSLVYRTDASGRVPADWLVQGHHYSVRPLGAGLSRGGFLKWEGQGRIDLSALPRSAPPEPW